MNNEDKNNSLPEGLLDETEFKEAPTPNFDDLKQYEDDLRQAQADFDKIEDVTAEEVKPEEKEPEEDPAEYEESAQEMIMSLDVACMFILPGFYRKKFFTPQEWSDLKKLERKIKATQKMGEKMTYDEYEVSLLLKRDEFKEIEETIELDEDEVERLTKPLSRVLAKYKTKPGPEFMLFTAMLSTFGLRFAPLFQKSL